MVLPAQRHRKFIAYLASQGPGFSELDMVGVARRALANETGLRRHKSKMALLRARVDFGSGVTCCLDV